MRHDINNHKHFDFLDAPSQHSFTSMPGWDFIHVFHPRA